MFFRDFAHLMKVKLKYNGRKYRTQQDTGDVQDTGDTQDNQDTGDIQDTGDLQNQVNQVKMQNIDEYGESLEKIRNSSSDLEWVNNVRNVNARLAVLKESYKLIVAFRRKRPRGEEMRLEMSEEEEGSSEDKRTRR